MLSKLSGQILTCIFLFWSLPVYANTPDVGGFLPAEIRITKVSDFNGAQLDSLRFFSKGDGKLQEIIWQADRPDESGFPQKASGSIAPGDELTFAASDLGEKASPADCDEISKNGDWLELEIEHSGRSFWVYGLNSQDDSMGGAFSSDLVSYRVKDDLVQTQSYQVGFQDVGNAKSFTWSKPDGT
ncbi:MAG TPA: hypothetical protein VJL89_06055, partial [Thermodesulfovibrionia bacterium]|nr:hypothetical protein [Thermodesulfovibrionia bacterium]